MRSLFKFSSIRKTHLHDYHINVLKAKMTEFAGYDMPVSYPVGVLKEHIQVREKVGLFDVSHMGQVQLRGSDYLKFTELLTTGDIRARKTGESHLCLILNKDGGIIDDTIVTKREDHVHIVINAGNKFIDLLHMDELKRQYNLKVDITYLEDKPLIAVQGPLASQLLSQLIDPKLAMLPFMNMVNIRKQGVEYQINRCGYTGEDGFEVSVEKDAIIQFCDSLLKTGLPIFCGLGARDSLRVEAGLCLHGHEIDENISPIEARLMWTVRKDTGKTEELKYYGFEALEQKQKEGVKEKRIGFIANEGIIRPPMDILDESGNKVGYLTSGSYSPVLKKGIGMGYVLNKFSKNSTKLKVVQRNQDQIITIVQTQFVSSKYFK